MSYPELQQSIIICKNGCLIIFVLFIHIYSEIFKIQNVSEPKYTYVWFLCQQSLISLKMYYAV